ncbi:hypothetical protein SAMN04489727_8596 [Amycolatopsis tolypomycina]|uniref:Uncharacterized protein n=1 Tax=Amycolatopsis tolypomycina TaxID=208445 RepID=A0A1H5C5K8_9PSEU|nr:hypothetical protein [Amycolatopsis tolypomycina]SED61654.1 hypothetical protein SAMN04489727_8596 [Amycolatopsis tolypomycina]
MLYLADGAAAEVVPGSRLREPALLALDGLVVSAWAADGPGGYEDYLLRTHGNAWGLWTEGDEFRFDATTGLLESLSVHLPEDNLADPGALASWLALPPVAGVPRRTDQKAFATDVAAERWCAEDGSVLAGLYGPAVGVPAEPLRLRVTDEFDLLFADGLLVGWMLENPERHLVGPADETLDAHPPDPDFAVLLKQYFDLVDHPHMAELFEEEAPEGRQLLAGLRERIALDRGATHRRAVLAKKVEDLDAQWYGSA